MGLPNLLIVGAAKSGTTSLHNYLNQHPDIFMCSPKEPHFLINKDIGQQRIPNGVIELDDYGILKKKTFYNMDDMENIKIVEATTEAGFRKNSFIYDFMSSMRQKINDPLGERAKKRKKISQR